MAAALAVTGVVAGVAWAASGKPDAAARPAADAAPLEVGAGSCPHGLASGGSPPFYGPAPGEPMGDPTAAVALARMETLLRRRLAGVREQAVMDRRTATGRRGQR